MEHLEAATLVQIGRNIRAERSRRDLTQEGVARRAGLATTQIARMERGETDSGISKYLRVAVAIGMSPADLFFGVEITLADAAEE
ncbi:MULTISPECIES: helix-turn-helix domain-containing protein [unclassified Nocardioides]|jgi:transcriptional regulator with XRE-family HTH domain|uniref:helix-turn-helix domain-containing protein n=1 Tax=unclassified Nocardioides TaxID=2615069 RepID=UPI0007026D19|nr:MULTISPECIES: helix-turn-helix transcriptional regulator [unclassified Nocardioides]KRC46315.1 hypothetical protein ASE19_20975 [Nocardioides sp. Root79]KRC69662.1 hypothetical protein ASE20_13835 [Nocardioides sp. Root240]